MENLKYLQYVLAIVLVVFAVAFGYNIKKDKPYVNVKENIVYIQQNDSLLLVVQELRDSLNKKMENDTIFITKKYTERVNYINTLPVDSALSFFTRYTSIFDYQ